MHELEQDFELNDNSVVVNSCEIKNEIVIEMADAKTLELFKGEKCDSMVARGGASRRIGFERSVGASTVNPDCPIRKQEEHNKRMIEKVVMKGTLANKDVHTHQLKDQVQSLTET